MTKHNNNTLAKNQKKSNWDQCEASRERNQQTREKSSHNNQLL